MTKKSSFSHLKSCFKQLLKSNDKSEKFVELKTPTIDLSGVCSNSPAWLPKDYVELAGALDESSISVQSFQGVMQIIVSNNLFTDPFVISAGFDNGVPQNLHLQRLRLKDDEQRRGVSTRLFHVQAKTAARLGFHFIKGNALYVEGGRGLGYNGAYTFGRLGFDGALTDDVKAELPHEVRHYETLLELMATPAGRNAWRANSKTIQVSFDLSPDSTSWLTLNKYLADKNIQLNL